MKPAPLEYKRARDLDHALELLAEYAEGAKPVAGGQSLIPLLNLRLARPVLLIDINDLSLDQVQVDGESLLTGALVRHRVVATDPEIRGTNGLLQEAARFIGHTAIRNRGTLGGSVAHADPAAEMPLVAVACDATMLLQSSSGAREVAAADYFVGPFMTSMEPDELLVGVRWPVLGANTSWGFSEIAERSGDFATAAAAVVLRGGADPLSARVAVTGVSGSPTRLDEVETALDSRDLDTARLWGAETMRDAVRGARVGLDSGEDQAPNRYVRHLVEEMVVRASLQALRSMRCVE